LRVALVGGFGFIGKHLIDKLADSYDLIVLSDSEGAKNAPHLGSGKQPIVEVGDIVNEEWVKDVMLRYSPDVAVHLAALTGVKKCNDNPSLAFSVNVLGTYYVIMGCVACRCRLIFMSSREVYGETGSHRAREDDPLAPNNIYGVTKMLAERLITWAASKHNLDHTILRLTNVYGPGGDQYNVQAMIRSAISQGGIHIMGGTQRMNLTYVEDVAEIIAKCLRNPRASHEIFNVGSKDNIVVEELVTKLISSLGIPVQIERKPMRLGETLDFQPDLDKMERTFGEYPRTTLNEGLQKTIRWYRNQSQGSAI